jgi:ADP-heptose:LPS heptosyltransferase
MQRILVLRGGALGDFLVTLPALGLLRRRWPTTRIELAGNAVAAALAVHRGVLDAVHSQHEARWLALFAGAPLPPPLADWLAGFDLIVNFWPDPEGELGRLFPLRPDQRYLSGDAHPTVGPAAAHYCRPLRELGLRPDRFDFALAPLEKSSGGETNRLPPPASAVASGPRPRRIALHPGSGSAAKNWPIERWLALARWLRDERGADLLWVAGPAEMPAAWAPRDDAAAVNLPLETLIDRLADCDAFLGHDSGVSHLAAALGLPGALWFGPTDPAVWAPPSPRIRVLQKGRSLAEISLADAQAIVSEILPQLDK